MSLAIAAVLAASGFAAGFFDSIVGGSGVITLPALLWAGLPPHQALGTNKLASAFASSTGSAAYLRSGHLDRRFLAWLIPFAFIGALAGAQTVLRIEQTYLKWIIFAVIVVIAGLTATRRRLGDENRFPGVSAATVAPGAAIALLLGFYDGFIGPGTGSFLLFAFLSVFRFDFITAAGNGRVLNFTSNAAALLLFALRGKVAYPAGLPMALGMMAGARLGSRLAIRRGAPFIRPLFVLVSLALAVRTGWSAFTTH